MNTAPLSFGLLQIALGILKAGIVGAKCLTILSHILILSMKNNFLHMFKNCHVTKSWQKSGFFGRISGHCQANFKDINLKFSLHAQRMLLEPTMLHF